MEPVSILAVAGNVLQFIDFGLKLLSKTKQIYNQSLTEENVDVEAIATHLKETWVKINGLSPPSSSAAATLQSQSITLIDELLQALNALKIKGQRTRWKSFRKAIKSASSKEKIDDWVRRLESLRDEYNFHLKAEIL